MKVTLNNNLLVNIEEIESKELEAFLNMICVACIQDKRVWYPVLVKLRHTPFDKLPFTHSLFLANEVKKMRSLQKQYFKTRSQDALRASIELERKVDDLVNEILNRQF